jgi:trehalose 6-phosphate synthase/phosphatase
MKKRLFIVSNRLPLIVDEDKGVLPASGGLITAISSYLEQFNSGPEKQEVYWAGVPGCSIDVWDSAIKKLDETCYKFLPVFVPDVEYENYYNGHSNSVIWPLFHYFPSYAEYNQEFYDSYLKVNELFAEMLLRELNPGDTVWIHDYHLMPLSQLLRKEMPSLTIGFFLHIPFPSFELFRLLPKKWQENILTGLLGADLIGFHTMDYASHFLQSVLMVLGLDNDRHVVHYNNRLIKVDVFPISIDFKKFHDAFDNEKVISQKQDLLREMNHRKVIFSVDRLDYSKGVQNRLKAYECFLQQNPEYHNNVVFIIVIVPSRDTIAKYAERKRMIDELISNINSKIGNIHWVPVIYQYNSLEFEEMVALYNTCDLALITPLRDGMNLVAKEFVASRKDKKGVLILSEMAGAARELTDALIINPNDITEIAQKIKEGLEMSTEEQSIRMEKMQTRISNYDVQAWADDFMRELTSITKKQKAFEIKLLDDHTRRLLNRSYARAGTRLLLLDYDGTLVSFSANPEMAVPGAELLRLLRDLCENELNDVFLISGRNASFLEKHFGALPINLVAEHGARYKLKDGEWTTEVQIHDEWKAPIHNIMEMYVRRCANSFIEEKEFSMVWHYRNANLEQGKLRALELSGELNEYIHNKHLQVLMGNKIVEVRQSGINKGNFIKRVLDKKAYDFVFSVGDDKTDEDMFRTLLEYDHAFTIKVGSEASYAKFNVQASPMVIGLLEGLNRIDAEVELKS